MNRRKEARSAMTKRINWKKILCFVLAILLSGAVEVALRIYADNNPIYLSDIKLFYVDHDADSTEAPIIAKAKCDVLGYTLLNADLNSGTGKDWVYIGYKTTTNKDLAITDIRVLGMDKDYYLYDYSEIIAYLKDSNTGTAYTLFNAANDFAAKYNAGSPKAADALRGLNLFYVNGQNQKFGDFLLAGGATVDFFTEMIVKASSGTVNAVMSFLNMGIAPFELNEEDDLPEILVYNGEGEETETYVDEDQTGYQGLTWADAMSRPEMLRSLNEDLTSAEMSELHKEYNDDAREVFKQLQIFATQYENALARNEDGAEEALDKLEDEIKSENIRTNSDAVDNMDELELEDTDVVFLSAYETLNRYTTVDGTPLGDWIVNLGLLTSDEVDISEVYPLVEAMGKAQAGIVKVSGLLAAVSNLGENENCEKLSNLIPEVQQTIQEYNGGDCVSIWDTADDDIENSYIAYTSDAVRVHNANDFIGKREKFDIIDEKLQSVLKWVNLATSVALATVMLGQTVMEIVTTCSAAAAAAVEASAFLMGLGTFMALASSVLMWVSIAALAISIGWALGKWIASLIKKVDPTIKHSKFPEYVFDVVDTSSGTSTVKYICVKDEYNQVGDLNARQQENWAALCYSTDTAAGSPVRVDDSGNIFRVVYGNGNVPNGYEGVNFFGERNPANLNYLTKKDNADGVFLSYRTERSLSQAAPASGSAGGNDATAVSATSYLADIVVSVGGSASEARAKITKRSGSYYIFDQNLSPGTNNYTYLGYSITNDPNEAITDIRVAPYQGNGNITFGDVQYTFIGHVGVNPGSDSSQTAGDAILKTKDPRAGSPIIADGLHLVSDQKEAKAGWEPVALFCGVAYNFASSYEAVDYGWINTNFPVYSGYCPLEGVNGYDPDAASPKHKNLYLYYEPTEQYTGGEKYLAGIFFLNGYDCSHKNGKWKTTDIQRLLNHAKDDPKVTVVDCNMMINLQHEVENTNKHDVPEMYLCYVYTYNPKRAVTDFVTFEGDSYSNTLPYSLSKGVDSTGASIGYAACSTFSVLQTFEEYMEHYEYHILTIINPFNAIVNGRYLYVSTGDLGTSWKLAYTKQFSGNFDYGFEKGHFLPLGLYLAGPADGKEPLKLSDVIVTRGYHEGKEENGRITFDVSGEKTLAGGDAVGAFRSVAEIKNPHSTEPVNLAFPDFYKVNRNKESDIKLYTSIRTHLYIRDNGTNTVGKYVSSVNVGYYSREKYRSDYLSQKQTIDEKEYEKQLKNVDAGVNQNAMLMAASGCADEMLCFNLSCAQEDAWYNQTDKDGMARWEAQEKDVPASYIGVTRTDKRSEAVTGILFYENSDNVTARQIKVDGAEYYCDSTTSPILMNGKKYYLYYTRNTGVNGGTLVEGISVNGDPMGSAGEHTALCANASSAKPFGDPDLPYYLHMKSEEQNGVFLTGLYIGKGTTERKAKCDLISQECCRFIHLDMNIAVSDYYLYLGYSVNYVDPGATAKQKTKAWREAIYDVIVTRNEPYHPEGFVCEKNNIFYYPVSDVNLNYGNDDADVLYLYYCSPYRSSRYNKEQKNNGIVTALPEEVFSAPLTKLALARYDRVPYLTDLDSTGGDTATDLLPWEYVLYASQTEQADFTSGSAKFEGDGYVIDNRITMFAQRYDGSVKPAGEITGGFNAEYMEFGILSAKQRVS